MKEAEQAYRADAARKPDDVAKGLALVEFLARRDRPQDALDLCESAIRKWPPEAVTRASLAIYQARSVTEPQRRKMEAWLGDIVREKPNDVVLNTKLGDLRTLQGKYAEAEALYRRALGANQDNVEALNNLAWQLALRDEDSAEALRLVDRALDIAGPNPALLGTRAVVLMQLSQGDKAVEALLEAVSSEPERPIYYFHLARAYQMTNAPSQARKSLARSKCWGSTSRPSTLWNGNVSQTVARNCAPLRNSAPADLPLSSERVTRRHVSDRRSTGLPGKKARRTYQN